MLAERTKRIGVSPTMKVAAEAVKLKAQGVDVIDFGAGEPDFPTPTHIGAAAHAAIDANFTKYTTNSGHRRTEARRLRAVQDRLRHRLHAGRDDHHRRRQAGVVQRRDVPVRAGRRSHHAHARLADAGRADQARRRDAGDRAYARRGRLHACAPSRSCAAITPRTRGIIINSPGESDRRADLGSRSWPRSPTKRPGAGSGSCSISVTTS